MVGHFNEISGQFASVSGGLGNTVIGSHSSISGGEFGKVRGSLSSISGGECNKVSGDGASISGGYNITQWSGYPLSLWPLSDLLRSAHRQHLPATPVAGPCPSASGGSACLTVSGVQHTRPPMPQSRQKTPILRAASGLPTA